MMPREELIEKMANAIRVVNLYGASDGHEYLEGSKILAKAALQALLSSLPELSSHEEDCQIEWEDAEHYKQLLSMKK